MIPGDALCLGFGYGPHHEPVPAGVLEHAGIDIRRGVAARAVRARDGWGRSPPSASDARPAGRIMPFGSADVVTLLGGASLRRELVSGEGDGMVALIVPLRTRGWRATYVSDPAYGPALAAAMPDVERGFNRPLLVTAEELSEVRAGRRPDARSAHRRRPDADGQRPPASGLGALRALRIQGRLQPRDGLGHPARHGLRRQARVGHDLGPLALGEEIARQADVAQRECRRQPRAWHSPACFRLRPGGRCPRA